VVPANLAIAAASVDRPVRRTPWPLATKNERGRASVRRLERRRLVLGLLALLALLVGGLVLGLALGGDDQVAAPAPPAAAPAADPVPAAAATADPAAAAVPAADTAADTAAAAEPEAEPEIVIDEPAAAPTSPARRRPTRRATPPRKPPPPAPTQPKPAPAGDDVFGKRK